MFVNITKYGQLLLILLLELQFSSILPFFLDYYNFSSFKLIIKLRTIHLNYDRQVVHDSCGASCVTRLFQVCR